MRWTARLLLTIPAIATLALAGPPAGGHSSSIGGGGHAGGVAHYGGGYSHGPQTTPTTSISGPAPLGASGPAPLGSAASFLPGRSGFVGFNGNGSRNHGYLPDRRPNNAKDGHRRDYPYVFYAAPYAYGYGGGYDNGYGNGYYDGNDYDPGPDYQADNSDSRELMMNQQALGHQVQQLTDQLQQLTEQRQEPQPANPAPSNASRPADEVPQNTVPVTLVLHSGRKLEVKNYAVTGGVFWDFSKQPAQRIPVSSIDVAESTKVTEASGGEFPQLN